MKHKNWARETFSYPFDKISDREFNPNRSQKSRR